MLTTRRRFLLLITSSAFAGFFPVLAPAQVSTTLESQFVATLKKLRRAGRIAADERVAIVIDDLVTRRKLVALNADRPMQCASMIKPFVIQAYLYCHYRKDPRLYPLDKRILAEMRGMIVESNNTYTNHLFKRLGGPQGVQWMLRKQAPQIFRNIDIVENIPHGGKTYRNRASASDYSRFLQAIWYNRLPGAELMKKLMGIRKHNRISVGTRYLPKTLTVYDKTGSTAMLCGDFGIIDYHRKNGASRPYTFVCIIEKARKAKNYSSWISARSDVIRDLSDRAYLYFSGKYS